MQLLGIAWIAYQCTLVLVSSHPYNYIQTFMEYCSSKHLICNPRDIFETQNKYKDQYLIYRRQNTEAYVKYYRSACHDYKIKSICPFKKKDNNILIMQSGDQYAFSDTTSMLKYTSKANSAYAYLHEFDYLILKGNIMGARPWLAANNRHFMINWLMQASHYDWVLYLDSDAVIYNANFDIKALITEFYDRAFLFCRGVRSFADSDINNGVYFINLRHAKTREITSNIVDYYQNFSISELKSMEINVHSPIGWDNMHGLLNDQIIMIKLFKFDEVNKRDISYLKVFKNVNFTLFNYNGPNVKHILRGHGRSREMRVTVLIETAKKVEHEINQLIRVKEDVLMQTTTDASSDREFLIRNNAYNLTKRVTNCVADSPKLASFNFSDFSIFQPNKMISNAGLTFSPIDEWKQLDYDGVRGFYSDYSSGNRSVAHPITITFPKVALPINGLYYITIRYLRTYKAAGIARIKLCGHIVSNIDALLPDYEANFRSTTEEYRLEVDSHTVQEHCESNIIYTLEIQHFYKLRLQGGIRGTKQLFLIESVDICVGIPLLINVLADSDRI